MPARDRLLLSTVGLMQRRGVAGTGVAEILDDSGASRRTIYLNFPGGKPELVAEATRWSGEWIAAQIEQACADATPAEALKEFVAQWRTMVTASDFAAGCPITAAATARSVAPDATSAAAEVFTRWHTLLVDVFVTHGASDVRARTLATTVVAAVEGAVVLAVAMRSAEPLDDVEAELSVLLGTAVPS